MVKQEVRPATHIHHYENGQCITCKQSFDWSDLSVMNVPKAMKKIGAKAFYGISAEAIIVPETCTSVDSQAFANCPNLMYLVLPADLENSIPSDAYDQDGQLEIIYYR